MREGWDGEVQGWRSLVRVNWRVFAVVVFDKGVESFGDLRFGRGKIRVRGANLVVVGIFIVG